MIIIPVKIINSKCSPFPALVPEMANIYLILMDI